VLTEAGVEGFSGELKLEAGDAEPAIKKNFPANPRNLTRSPIPPSKSLDLLGSIEKIEKKM
jgi:hypothetical protein